MNPIGDPSPTDTFGVMQALRALLQDPTQLQALEERVRALSQAEADACSGLMAEALNLKGEHALSTLRCPAAARPEWIHARGNGGTLFWMAIEKDRADLVDALLALGVCQGDCKPTELLTALIRALWANPVNPSIVGSLLDAGRLSRNDLTKALSQTVTAGMMNASSAATLLAHGARLRWGPAPKTMDKALLIRPLVAAAHQGNAAILSLLLAYKDSARALNEGYEAGLSPLHAAIQALNLPGLRLLLEAGARVNPLPGSSVVYTPLMAAAERVHPDMVEALLDHGADPLVRSAEGHTPFHFLADVRVFGDQGSVAWDEEMANDTLACATRLLAAGCDPFLADHVGRTPLGIATGRDILGIPKGASNPTLAGVIRTLQLEAALDVPEAASVRARL